MHYNALEQRNPSTGSNALDATHLPPGDRPRNAGVARGSLWKRVRRQHTSIPPLRSGIDEALDIPDWAGTVDRIRAGDSHAMTELYSVFTRGIRYLLLRTLGVEEVDDRVHDCFLVVTEAICAGELRDPARLMGYVRTIVRRHIAASIEEAITRRRTTVEFEDSAFSVSDWKANPEQNLLARQREEIARRVFRGVSGRDREVLRRFYLLEQSHEQICGEMDLTYNQFRLLKSRAKARFGKLGRRLAENGNFGLADIAGVSGDEKNIFEKKPGRGY